MIRLLREFRLRYWLKLHREAQHRAWVLTSEQYWAEWYAHHLSHKSRREARDAFLEEATRNLL